MEVGHWGLKVPRVDLVLQALLTPPWDGQGAEHRAIAGTNLVMLSHIPAFKRAWGAWAWWTRAPGDHISQGFCSPNSCDGMAKNY